MNSDGHHSGRRGAGNSDSTRQPQTIGGDHTSHLTSHDHRNTDAGASHSAPAPFYSATKVQLEIMRFIQGYVAKTGKAPTYRQIGAGLGKAVGAALARSINCLIERKYLRRRNHKLYIAREVAIPRAPDGEPLFFVKPPHNPTGRISNSNKSLIHDKGNSK